MELGFILLKTLPKAINMYMELEEVPGVQFTKTDLVTFAIGKRSLVLIYFDKNQIRTGFMFENFGVRGCLLLALSPVRLANVSLMIFMGQAQF